MRSRSIIVAVLCLLLMACERTELYGDLSQSQANEILVVLHQHHIDAKLYKELRQNNPFYSITVDPDDLDAARALLSEFNLPRLRKPGLGEVYKDNSPIPTKEEQHAKYLFAKQNDVINAIESIESVVSAEVIITIPQEQEFGSEQEPERPSASVVVRARPTSDAVALLTQSELQRFVANAVEGLDPRDVAVMITYSGSPAAASATGDHLQLPPLVGTAGPDGATSTVAASETVPFAGLAVGAESVGRLKLYLIIFLVLVAALSLGLVVMVVQSSRMRQGSAVLPALPEAEQPPQLEAGE